MTSLKNNVFKRHLLPWFGTQKVRDIAPEDVIKLLDHTNEEEPIRSLLKLLLLTAQNSERICSVRALGLTTSAKSSISLAEKINPFGGVMRTKHQIALAYGLIKKVTEATLFDGVGTQKERYRTFVRLRSYEGNRRFFRVEVALFEWESAHKG